ncbi:MAG TPA: DUF6541 family protein [Intrasporangium sp.]|uniref:DUF6541 family protein n=1 Tax=Intrasporangium sp. TaxID=1925024 RepID=UPI002D775C31|nr:DUF6541 family protein [Intrasporangium sp.]HET7399285.1 DUF6541 family protein [Intrasporangium sp.]
MASWTEAIPVLTVLTALLLVPGWLVVRALGARGLEAVAISPAVSVAVLGGWATVAGLAGVRWSLPLLVAATAGTTAVAALLGHLLHRDGPHLTRSRRWLGRPRPDAAVACGIGVAVTLITLLPAIGRPDELVDSPDAVFHLNRVRLFLDTGNFAPTNGSLYPSGFHAWTATGMLAVHVPILAAANAATVVLAAVVWPVGCVALVRHALGTSRLVLYAGGFAAAGFVAFPTMLLGWGVLWPNLMGTALTSGALALMLQAARSRRPGQVLAFVAALPGLALVHPNALVSLVVFALAWFFAARLRAGVLGHSPWTVVVRDIAAVVAVVAAGVLAAPLVSSRLAATQAYGWPGHVSVWTALVESVGGRLQVTSVAWGLLALVALGTGWILTRARAAAPVLAMWVCCVGLYVLAASSTSEWTALVTGYWYNDKVRLASLATVPGVVMVAAAAPALRALLRRVPALRRAPFLVAAAAVGAVPLLTVVADHADRSRLLRDYFHPALPERIILDPARQADLERLAAFVPPGQVVAGRPENGSPLLYALTGTRTLYRSIPMAAAGDEVVIGTGLRDMAARPDVCAALRRQGVRFVVESPDVYWLDLPERSSGLMHLAAVPGLTRVATSGRYTLYRITACGLA